MVTLKNGLDQILRGKASRSSLQNMDFKVPTLATTPILQTLAYVISPTRLHSDHI